MESNPSYLRGKAWLAAAEALAGDVERAGLHLADYIALEPQMTVRRFAAERSSVPLDAVSLAYRRESERILEGLRHAGMPEEIAGGPVHTPEIGTVRPEVSHDRPRNAGKGLSVPVSELIGREAELFEVTALVTKHRLVTLTGEGGIGKTHLGIDDAAARMAGALLHTNAAIRVLATSREPLRVAADARARHCEHVIEVARHLLSEFADGARVAELAPLSDPELVPVAVATALGLELAAGAMSAERVANALGGKRKENTCIGCRRSLCRLKTPTRWRSCCDTARSGCS
jgi:hypothetical protein